MQQKITPNLWFNGNALEAAEYYQSVFPDGKITSVVKYPNSVEEGLAEFQLSEAISFQVDCKDKIWPKLANCAKKHGTTYAKTGRLFQNDADA